MQRGRYNNSITRTLHPLHAYGPVLNGDIGRFTLWCRDAVSLDLLLFEHAGDLRPLRTVSLNPGDHRLGDVWSVEVPGVKAGMCYVWKLDREEGKTRVTDHYVLDPYAPAIHGSPHWGQSMIRHPGEPLSNGPAFPKGVVVDSSFDWGDDPRPSIPWKEMVVYEAHVRGMTAGPNSGVNDPGTYAGLIEKIPYLKKLGITSLELMPVFEFDEMEYFHHNDPRANLRNYWGYSTLGFFAPNGRYAAAGVRGQQVDEFKSLVKALHRAGIEVILDVVYNHTAEGGEGGNTYSFRELGRDTYYIHDSKNGYHNYSGCGNTVNCNHPVVRQFILDSLRHWVLEYHIDGFRFDLAPILCRGRNGALLERPPLIEEIDEDPILRHTKMIAEAWDAAGAYQVGSFPSTRWPEWNGKYRDDVRRFWSGEPGMLSAFATRVLGSEDLYSGQPLGALKSVNFVCCHDGFSLRDVVSYRDKHNEANLENNRDGENRNHSSNFGVEGPTQDPEINRLRLQMQKNFLATLLISRGIPMFPAGDEIGRTQHGNNNAYCQDNELSWLDWNLEADQTELLAFTREMIKLRKDLPALQFGGLIHQGPEETVKGRVRWIGQENREPNWGTDQAVGLLISGQGRHIGTERDHQDVLIFFNASAKSVRFHIPDTDQCKWKPRLHTCAKRAHRTNLGTQIQTKAHSVMIYSASRKKS